MCLGIPGQIVAITDASRGLATVDVAGVKREISVAFVRRDGETVEELIGAWVLVHVGFAMSRIDEDEAAETLKILAELGEVAQETEAMRTSARA